MLRDNYAIGVFLDIAGAFDNLDPKKAVEGMVDHHFPPEVVKWYGHYLGNRSASTELNGTVHRRSIKKGTPQGGVLSTSVWNVSFDSFLSLYDEGPITARGFADDGALLGTGIDLPTIMANLQVAVNKATKWGALNGLNLVRVS